MGGTCFDWKEQGLGSGRMIGPSTNVLQFIWNISSPEPPERVVLDAETLRIIAQGSPDLLSTISEADIHDKSKASGFAKTLVCVQATWFCIQCVFRLAQGKAISLLELNAFAHALCAVLIYAMWWSKPFDPEEPTILRGSLVKELAAFLCLKLDFEAQELAPWKPWKPEEPPVLTPAFHSKSLSLYYKKTTASDERLLELARQAQKEENQPPLRPGYTRIYVGEEYHGFYPSFIHMAREIAACSASASILCAYRSHAGRVPNPRAVWVRHRTLGRGTSQVSRSFPY